MECQENKHVTIRYTDCIKYDKTSENWSEQTKAQRMHKNTFKDFQKLIQIIL